MMMPNAEEANTLGIFFDFLYETTPGIVYVALKPIQKDGPVQDTDPKWGQKFFSWPLQRGELIETVHADSATWEVYVGPALKKGTSGTKETVMGSHVYWVDFDQGVPNDLKGLPAPSLRIKSSIEGTKEHWYWKSNNFITDIPQLERVNRGLMYAFGADESGWDANQILRPPETFNHKRSAKTALIEIASRSVDISDFNALPVPPPVPAIPLPDDIPDIADVIAKRVTFSDHAWNLFQEGSKKLNSAGTGFEKSDALMELGYILAEQKLTVSEILSVILNADSRWGKFADRSDRMQRLLEIVSIAKHKYPDAPSKPSVEIIAFGFRSLLTSDFEVQWLIEGWLEKSGYMLLTGMSGIGKTQLALHAAASIALGRDWLTLKTRQGRIGVLSLEMGTVQLKQFILAQARGYTEPELDHLDKNVILFPLGEPLYLNNGNEAERIANLAVDFNLDGLIIDSMGASIDGELSTEKSSKELMDWNDRFRKSTGIFTWFIHHHRKAQSENAKPKTLADVYGSQYLTSRATTVACLWPTRTAGNLELSSLKLRLAERPEPVILLRDKNLNFTKYSSGPDRPVLKTATVGLLEL